MLETDQAAPLRGAGDRNEAEAPMMEVTITSQKNLKRSADAPGAALITMIVMATTTVSRDRVGRDTVMRQTADRKIFHPREVIDHRSILARIGALQANEAQPP